MTARMEIYQGQDSLAEVPYCITGQIGKIGSYAFLADGEGKIQAVLTTESAGYCKYRLYLSGERMSGRESSRERKTGNSVITTVRFRRFW